VVCSDYVGSSYSKIYQFAKNATEKLSNLFYLSVSDEEKRFVILIPGPFLLLNFTNVCIKLVCLSLESLSYLV
jgi:hypothetical protein